ncbi:Unknown protein [Striga hermonthica]|uniref:Zinc finger C2HC5-type domain-containing protein n=1 Tax=Striga hermonthica TaxID=68872 RepID=A0A9N7N5G6_STRHE|nr:Unknown protein [Striga hermonthica]
MCPTSGESNEDRRKGPSEPRWTSDGRESLEHSNPNQPVTQTGPGPWMVAQKRTRSYTRASKPPMESSIKLKGGSSGSGSRFLSLAVEEEGDKVEQSGGSMKGDWAFIAQAVQKETERGPKDWRLKGKDKGKATSTQVVGSGVGALNGSKGENMTNGNFQGESRIMERERVKRGEKYQEQKSQSFGEDDLVMINAHTNLDSSRHQVVQFVSASSLEHAMVVDSQLSARTTISIQEEPPDDVSTHENENGHVTRQRRRRKKMGIESSGEWLEKALMELCKKIETGLDLDGEIITGLVSYCEMASPLDAKEYLDNIIGEVAGKTVTEEYLKRRGHSTVSNTHEQYAPTTSNLQAYVKPRADEGTIPAKKTHKPPKEAKAMTSEPQNIHPPPTNRKKKSGKVVSLAEAAKGSIVFQKGKPCSCQARRHMLISNCLSCGKIVCEQEGEGPCSFCGALVLKEGSTYAGLDEGVMLVTDAEAAAEAYAKRLVDYDRNSAARTTVIDDQSDYYELESNTWLSNEEKELLRKKREELEEAERAKRSKVVMTIDLLGRKVLLNEDEASEEMQNSILLRPPEEREEVRIKPNPNLKIQPVFIDPGPRIAAKEKSLTTLSSGLCLEISGRVQHRTNELDIL